MSEKEKIVIDKPLVSVLIIAYNSSAYILDTLDSIKCQDYPNIELIISDDCSTDNTIDLCNEWIIQNRASFQNVKLVSTNVNSGVSKNCNTAAQASTGEWLKILAADDQLFPYSITEYVDYVLTNKKQICSSRSALFTEEDRLLTSELKSYNNFYKKINQSHKKQLALIRYKLYIPAPAIFFSRSLYDKVKGFDERYPFCEEWPFYYNVLEAGFHIGFLNKELVRYRIVCGSLSRDGNQLNKRVFDDIKRYYYEVRIYKLLRRFMLSTIWQTSLKYAYQERRYKEKTRYSLSILIIKILILIDPIRPFVALRRLCR